MMVMLQMSEYHYAQSNGETLGPVSVSDLKSLFLKKKIDGNTRVWCEGMAEWLPINSVPDLKKQVTAPGGAPPSLPPLATGAPAMPKEGSKPPKKNCAYPACLKASTSGGYCNMHVPRAATPAAGSLLKGGGWEERRTIDGVSYYYEPATEKLSWEKPDVLKTEEELSTETGDWCWVRDEREAWVPARKIKKLADGSTECQTQAGAKVVLAKADPLWEFTLSSLNNLEDDIVMLDSINEGQIIHNLRERYKVNKIYTWVGANKTVLISVNPFQMLPIYTPEVIEEHAHPPPNKGLEPHVFDIAHGSFKAMSIDRKNQSILISGESGAGKTEATKQCLSFLADVAESASNVESKILMANPVLEAFGNAKTLRNNNSSRFGKWIEVYFDELAHISGAKIENYLLEKSRVAVQAAGERNYHIFYQLFESSALKSRYGLSKAENYRYTNQSGCIKVPGVDDRKDHDEVVVAMKDLGFSEEEKTWILDQAAGVLYLGNMKFSEKSSAGTVGSAVENKGDLGSAAKFLGITADALEKGITNRSIEVRGSKTNIPLKPAEAVSACDALAKALYGNMFNWLVQRVNESLKGKSGRFIGILDIFGFEIFEQNSFEQLCINFANEKLQQHFNKSTFKEEEAVYTSEGVKFEHVKFIDNQPVLDMIEKKPYGILLMLDEEIRLPEGSDSNFMKKSDTRHGEHPNYVMDRKLRFKSPLLFCVNHYAGSVIYDSAGFMEKNKDSLYQDMYDMMSDSSLKLTKVIFPKKDSRVSRTTSLSSQFCNQLNELMKVLYDTQPRYIRCVKPNAEKKANTFNSVMSIEQLRYSGVFEAVQIRKQGYPFRLLHKQFVYRYKCIAFGKDGKPPKMRNAADYKKAVPELLSMRKEDFSGIAIGSTMALYKAQQHRLLELMRNLALENLVPTAQRVMKGHLAREMRRRLKKTSGLLDNALKVGNDIKLLDDAIEKATTVIGTLAVLFDYTPKRLPEAKELRLKLIEWTKVTEILTDLLKKDASSVYLELGAAIVRADGLKAIPHTKLQKDTLEKAKEKIATCASAKIDPEAEEALYLLDKDRMTAILAEAKSVGYDSPVLHEITVMLALPEAELVKFQLRKAVELNDPVRRINREIKLVTLQLEANTRLFKFQSYSQLLHPVEFANKKLLTFNGKALAESMLKWTTAPLHTSLTVLPPPLVKEACRIHKSILGFMQDRKYPNPNVLAANILEKGFAIEGLRTEIYCQIIKQLTENPNASSVDAGWALMALCVQTFPASLDFENYLLVYLFEYGPEKGKKYISAVHNIKYDGMAAGPPALEAIEPMRTEFQRQWKRSRYSIEPVPSMPPGKKAAGAFKAASESKRALLPPVAAPTKGLKAIVRFDFDAKDDENMISVGADEEVVVIEQDGDDWWMVQSKGREGYVPASYLEML